MSCIITLLSGRITTGHRTWLVVVMVIRGLLFFIMFVLIECNFKTLHQLVLLLLGVVNRHETVHDQRVSFERVDRVHVGGARLERLVHTQDRVGIYFGHVGLCRLFWGEKGVVFE